ncbi:MAG: FKBP-type peptidyl-prolyl cis-trans isomerase [Chloroflexota bacterium]|nr:FKBP-type peptidyl-prolyl cis-trans isomerase [Chloroflexota bacterium]
MSHAKSGDTVKVHYNGKFDDGTQFETTLGKAPLVFKIGEGDVIPGFAKAVSGMVPGEIKTIRIPSDEAYGPRDENLVGMVDRSDFPSEMNLKPGQVIKIEHPAVVTGVITIVEVSGLSVIIDANHPLAEKDLNFMIHLVEILW